MVQIILKTEPSEMEGATQMINQLDKKTTLDNQGKNKLPFSHVRIAKEITELANGSYVSNCPKIHFLALVAPDFDYDILLNWMDHYYKLKLDTYTAFIHKDLCNDKYKWLLNALTEHGFRISYVEGPFGNSTLRLNVMNAFAMNIPDDEYIMVADSDEFQQWPENDVRKALLNGEIDVIEGTLIDCFTDKLIEADNSHLHFQYPKRTINLEGFLSPRHHNKINKICVAKNKFPVCFCGSHVFNSSIPGKKLSHNMRTRSGIEVLHYRWRATLKKRLKAKGYDNDAHALKLLGCFEE